MKAFMTDLSKLIKEIKETPDVFYQKYIDGTLGDYEDYIVEIELHKNNKDSSCPEDRLVYFSEDGEKWIYLSQLNVSCYHLSKYLAIEEVRKAISNSIIKKPLNKRK